MTETTHHTDIEGWRATIKTADEALVAMLGMQPFTINLMTLLGLLFGRSIDEPGRAYWAGKLDAGATNRTAGSSVFIS